MAAIVTNNFRKNNVDLLLEEINSQASPRNEYFVGLGKSDPWSNVDDIPTIPTNTETENQDVLRNLIGLVKLDSRTDYKAAKIIAKNGWISGRKYKKYDPADITNFDLDTQLEENVYPSYVTYNDNIYVCLQNGYSGGEIKASSTNPSSGSNDDYGWYEATDGYVWSLIGNVGTGFVTDQFVEVPQDSANASPTSVTSGLLYGFHVEEGTITTSPTPKDFVVKLEGELLDGRAITQTLSDVNVIANDTEIVRIEFDASFGDEDSPIGSHLITDLKQANIILEDDDSNVLDEIKVIPLIAPEEGFGAYPSKDLPTTLLGIIADFNSNLEGEVPLSSFRQVSLIKNAIRDYGSPDNSGDYSAEGVYDTLKSMTLDAVANIQVGEIIVGVTSGARAYVDSISGNTIYYHQNSNNDVNTIPFDSTGENIIDETDQVVGTLASGGLTSPEYQPLSGEVLFLENRTPIQRANNQNEQVRLVIQL